jgi:hypothetical protein
MEIQLKLEGPFSIFPTDSIKSVFEMDVANSPGIYLWTIPYENKYLANYVGITTKSFNQRFARHIEDLYAGKSVIYDTYDFINAKKTKIYFPTANVADFPNKYRDITAKIYDYVKSFCLFVAPLELKKEYLKRVESSIILNLQSNENVSKSFLDNLKISSYFNPEEKQLSVFICNSELILGLGESINA